MKKRILLILLHYTSVIIFIGCSNTQKTAEVITEPQPVLLPKMQSHQLQTEENYKIWRQNDFRQIRVGDPISFFNSSEIVLNGTFSEEVYKFIDGKVRKVTILKYVTKIVPTKTPGRLISMKIIDGIIYEMKMDFSLKDGTYLFTFVIASDDSFILYGNAPLIFEGNEYKTTATTTKTCQLLWDFSEDIRLENINGKAEGIRVSSSKTITIE